LTEDKVSANVEPPVPQENGLQTLKESSTPQTIISESPEVTSIPKESTPEEPTILTPDSLNIHF